MSHRNLLTRGAIASTALAGALALGLPGIASAAAYSTPTVTATVDGDKITTTVTDTATTQDGQCTTYVVPAAAALTLVTSTPTPDEFAAVLATPGVQTGTVKTSPLPAPAVEKAVNTFTVAPGAWVVLAACGNQAGDQSSNYTLVFSPGGVGSLSQGLGLGSAVLSMEGGSSLLPGLLTSGVASSMLGSS